MIRYLDKEIYNREDLDSMLKELEFDTEDVKKKLGDIRKVETIYRIGVSYFEDIFYLHEILSDKVHLNINPKYNVVIIVPDTIDEKTTILMDSGDNKISLRDKRQFDSYVRMIFGNFIDLYDRVPPEYRNI